MRRGACRQKLPRIVWRLSGYRRENEATLIQDLSPRCATGWVKRRSKARASSSRGGGNRSVFATGRLSPASGRCACSAGPESIGLIYLARVFAAAGFDGRVLLCLAACAGLAGAPVGAGWWGLLPPFAMRHLLSLVLRSSPALP